MDAASARAKSLASMAWRIVRWCSAPTSTRGMDRTSTRRDFSGTCFERHLFPLNGGGWDSRARLHVFRAAPHRRARYRQVERDTDRTIGPWSVGLSELTVGRLEDWEIVVGLKTGDSRICQSSICFLATFHQSANPPDLPMVRQRVLSSRYLFSRSQRRDCS